MFSAERQQVEICLLKSNLEEIEHDLASQWSAVPELEAQGNKIREQTMRALQESRVANAELERLKAENGHLSVKQVSLKRQLEEISRSSAAARATRDTLARSLARTDGDIDQLINSYEKCMAQMAERFRSTQTCYYEEEVNKEIEYTNAVMKQRETESKNKQKLLENQKARVEEMHPKIPEELPEICRKPELSKQVDDLKSQFKKLSAKRFTY